MHMYYNASPFKGTVSIKNIHLCVGLCLQLLLQEGVQIKEKVLVSFLDRQIRSIKISFQHIPLLQFPG